MVQVFQSVQDLHNGMRMRDGGGGGQGEGAYSVVKSKRLELSS